MADIDGFVNMKDDRRMTLPNELLLDAKRMIAGGFDVLVDTGEGLK